MSCHLNTEPNCQWWHTQLYAPFFYIKQLLAMAQRANLENIPNGAVKRKSCPQRSRCATTLLQGLTWFYATQTGCRWLISYTEQKKFLAWEPEFYVEFSVPPEFSGGVMEKCLSTGEARTSHLQITKQILYHCATAALYINYKKLNLFLAGIFRPFL